MEEDIEQDDVQSDEDLRRESYALNEIMKRDILWNEKGGPQTPEEKRQRELDDQFIIFVDKENSRRKKIMRAKELETGYIELNPIRRKIREVMDMMDASFAELENDRLSN